MSSLKKNIIWLASYPKSGNTWIRIFLANYLSNSNQPIDVNNIDVSTISSARADFDTFSGVLSSDLTADEIDLFRPDIYKNIAESEDNVVFIKTHDANHTNTNNIPLFPEEVTLGVVHIIRNPLSVVPSYAHHFSFSIDEAIDALNNDENKLSFSIKKLTKQLRQQLFSWNQHFESWQQTKSPYLLIRYEDLKVNPYETFKQLLLFIYKEVDEERLKKAIVFSDFKQLKSQEQKASFKEKPIKSESFFRKGNLDSWKEELTEKQAQQIIKNHKKIMCDLNYL